MKLYPIPEAAERLGIGQRQVWEELRAGRLKAKKIGRRTLVSDKEIGRYIRTLPERARWRPVGIAAKRLADQS